MFPRQCLGYWRVTAFRWSSPTSPSCSSVLRGKGRLGVNVTFYLLIFHRLGGKWGARLVWKKEREWEREVREMLQEEDCGQRYQLGGLFFCTVVVLTFFPQNRSPATAKWENLSRKCLVHISPQIQKKVNRYYILEKIVILLPSLVLQKLISVT